MQVLTCEAGFGTIGASLGTIDVALVVGLGLILADCVVFEALDVTFDFFSDFSLDRELEVGLFFLAAGLEADFPDVEVFLLTRDTEDFLPAELEDLGAGLFSVALALSPALEVFVGVSFTAEDLLLGACRGEDLTGVLCLLGVLLLATSVTTTFTGVFNAEVADLFL